MFTKMYSTGDVTSKGMPLFGFIVKRRLPEPHTLYQNWPIVSDLIRTLYIVFNKHDVNFFFFFFFFFYKECWQKFINYNIFGLIIHYKILK